MLKGCPDSHFDNETPIETSTPGKFTKVSQGKPGSKQSLFSMFGKVFMEANSIFTSLVQPNPIREAESNSKTEHFYKNLGSQEIDEDSESYFTDLHNKSWRILEKNNHEVCSLEVHEYEECMIRQRDNWACTNGLHTLFECLKKYPL